ncbi:tyrosine-type recombinase/integrase [Acidiluteibacter ferrifornacis]|uniref:Tyrosine-type recombinase/integrase n=1 Tax=Acidiluteibacter ferrifornacis TaxID=2692424 RepID=A0A6N9NL64_9FLAO|nr:tyrosine-type recombinase/integrase [Acidiluteibacter ferrifornacis]NBG66599.1 tyrosine-type recombinase/integrase [Acidiluteibacter ferrifornacis]
MLKKFIDFLRNEKRCSENTILAYQNDLVQFSEFLEEQYSIKLEEEEIFSDHIRSWMVFMVDSGISSRTINRKMTTLKSYFKFLLQKKIVNANPTYKIRSLKNHRKLPQFVSEKEMFQLFESYFVEDSYECSRDRIILELFYATGIRLSELINLKFRDIDYSKGVMKVLGKRNKERFVPLYTELLQRLSALQMLNQELVSNADFVFLTKKGTKIYSRLVYRIVNTYLSQASNSEKRSPHVLRHTFATHLLNNGAELNTIKELLGHTSLAATQVYTHNSIEKLKMIYQQAHPRA